MTAAVEFLVKLRKIDQLGLTTRDIQILWAVAREPGMMGQELTKKLGFKTRSNIQYAFPRLIEKGYLEDRRPRGGVHHVPNDFYITPAGEALLADLIPAG